MDECDVCVPRNQVAEFINYTYEIQDKLNIRIKNFGHAGDGNLHIYILRDKLPDDEWKKKLSTVFDLFYAKAKELHGVVSGEHGIGYAKKGYLLKSIGKEEQQLMNRIKLAFDPKNILNPHKICQ